MVSTLFEDIASILLVTRAKYAISFFNPVQGSVPARPMPMFRVAATIKVNSKGIMVEDGAASLSEGMALVLEVVHTYTMLKPGY
jgi:hypothetical protein